MRMTLLLITLMVSSVRLVAADSGSDRPEAFAYELQRLAPRPGKRDALLDWLRARGAEVARRHGVAGVACLVPAGDDPAGEVLWLTRCQTANAATARGALRADAECRRIDPAAGEAESLVAKVESMALVPTAYSPVFAPAVSAEPRVFELRTYTCPSPEKRALLDDRFREHTMALFQKHGMQNLVYWHPGGVEGGERKLVYLLGHASVDAARESFAAFRKDPDWLAAKEASEAKAGGSLTEKERGVISEFFLATGFSPLQ
jgi:hypothetical protein